MSLPHHRPISTHTDQQAVSPKFSVPAADKNSLSGGETSSGTEPLPEWHGETIFRHEQPPPRVLIEALAIIQQQSAQLKREAAGEPAASPTSRLVPLSSTSVTNGGDGSECSGTSTAPLRHQWPQQDTLPSAAAAEAAAAEADAAGRECGGGDCSHDDQVLDQPALSLRERHTMSEALQSLTLAARQQQQREDESPDDHCFEGSPRDGRGSSPVRPSLSLRERHTIPDAIQSLTLAARHASAHRLQQSPQKWECQQQGSPSPLPSAPVPQCDEPRADEPAVLPQPNQPANLAPASLPAVQPLPGALAGLGACAACGQQLSQPTPPQRNDHTVLLYLPTAVPMPHANLNQFDSCQHSEFATPQSPEPIGSALRNDGVMSAAANSMVVGAAGSSEAVTVKVEFSRASPLPQEQQQVSLARVKAGRVHHHRSKSSSRRATADGSSASTRKSSKKASREVKKARISLGRSIDLPDVSVCTYISCFEGGLCLVSHYWLE